MPHAGPCGELRSRPPPTPSYNQARLPKHEPSAAGMAVRRPSGREDFEIGIICALPLEYNAVSLIFDEFWDEDGDPYGRAAGDYNNYTTGRIGKYNVVLALLSHMGKTNATSAAHSLRLSYSGLRFVLLVGICGGVPRVGAEEILLGDVVISKTIVQYDLGRRYPDEYLRKDTVEDNLSKSNKEVQNLLVTFETDRGIELLYRRTASFLKELQAIAAKRRKSRGKYNYPGTAEDKLFKSNYSHGIPRTRRTSGRVCDESFNLSCEEVGCDKRHLVLRERLEMKRQLEPDNIDEAQKPAIYVGPIASGDTVMKSGEDRDRIARKEGVIAFEMEAAGVWEELPCCIVVKGVCDYADSHKNKKWQNFAAATASSVTKVLLERLIQEDKPLAPATRDERADASNMLQNSSPGCNIARLQQENNIMGLPESNLLTILMSQLARGLPPQIKHQDPVTVIDARNRPIPFFLDTIGSVELFTEVLEEKFKDLGLGKIRRGEWYLEDHYTGKILNLTKPWKSLIRPGQLLDMTMIFRRRNISSTQCPACRSKNFDDPETQVTCHMCALTYRRIEEIQEIPILEEGSQPQPRTAVSQATPKGEHKVLAPFPRPRPLKPQNDDDDISRYSRVQIIDTSFQIQKARESKLVAGIATLNVRDLDDPERLAAYLAMVCGLPEEDCLVALRECETQLLAIRAEFEQSLANDIEGTADVFTDDESSLIIRIRRWQSNVKRPDFEGIISETDEDEDEWKSRKQKSLEITLPEAQGSYAEPNELTELSDIPRISMSASRQDLGILDAPFRAALFRAALFHTALFPTTPFSTAQFHTLALIYKLAPTLVPLLYPPVELSSLEQSIRKMQLLLQQKYRDMNE